MKINSPKDFKPLVNRSLGFSGWRRVTQMDVNAFAQITDDNQWIHTNPDRAQNSSIGNTVVQGFFTLALAPGFVREIITVEKYAVKINYGLDKVRFPAPFQVGRRVRMHLQVLACEELQDSVETTMGYRFDCKDLIKPVCVAEQINRWYL